MKSFTTAISKYEYKTLIYDIFALTVVVLTPALSHLSAIPLYLLEPMRVVLLLSIVFTSRKNVYLLTLVLPLFSFIISTHPAVIKSLLITSEMFLNVFLFFTLLKYFKKSFPSAILSIMISKIYYYLLKFSLISFGFITSELISTPVILQIAVGLSISVFLFFFYKKERLN
ncbi:MAG: hypothetical protein CVV24_12520 [Ignavibacteriae bacterium HGW-Ignavibacteriae-3]|nr:MAG: hypothetical protein CVV24_12520 [Ignavibacteriae bacterium HGW-Ignavibacteriae-3]